MENKRFGYWAGTFRRFKSNKWALAGLAIIVFMILLAAFAPWLSPYSPAKQTKNVKETLLSPALKHPMGTDGLGRDIFSRLLWGARISLSVGIIAIFISLALGIFLGALAGYYGGIIDTLIMRLADIFFAFPWFLGALLFMAILGPGFFNVFIAIGVLGWASFGRLFRASVIKVRESGYVEAAQAVGTGDLRIILKHIFPNAFAPVLVYGVMSMGTAILIESVLSFLRVGTALSQASWGSMLADSQKVWMINPWTMIFPGLAIFITVLGFVLLSDGLRDAFDPFIREVE